VHIFAIDPQTQLLTETASSPLPGFTSVPALMLDPTGPFMYQSDATGTSVQAFQIDPLTGYFTAVVGTTRTSRSGLSVRRNRSCSPAREIRR
jgi:hypothetical protein